MRRLSLTFVAVCTALLPAAGQSTAALQQPSLQQTLERVGRYVDIFLREGANVVAEEDYVQRSDGVKPETRRLKSDLAIMLDERAGWLAFRDVFEVDGEPVRDREDRLLRLFTQPSADAMARARQIATESARYNLNPQRVQIPRTLNLPVTTLKFLLAANQPRSMFRLDFTSRDGRQVARLRFTERAMPRIVSTPGNTAATGEVLVMPDTGAVLQTDMTLNDGVLDANLRTTYAAHTGFQAFMPRSMEESYVGPLRGASMVAWRVDGRATYSNFRTFGVSVDTSVKPAE